MISEEIKIGPWYFTFESREEYPEYGSVFLSSEEEQIAYGEFVNREDWDSFKKAARL